MTDSFIARLQTLEAAVVAGEGDVALARQAAIVARWEFGREVIAQRIGKKLPPGRQAQILCEIAISQSELSNRTLVADHYTTEHALTNALVNGVDSWRSVVASVPKRPRPQGNNKSRQAKKTGLPGPAAHKAADSVEKALDDPNVRKVLKDRQAQSAAQLRARRAAEKAERDADREQVEQEREDDHFVGVLRQRLVKGDADWQELNEMFEVMGDNVQRVRRLLPGLPVPDQMRFRRFTVEIGKLQQGLLDLSGELANTTTKKTGTINRPGVIDVN
jgi:hypothetical protein